LWGWRYESVGAPFYWPWVDSLRTYVQRMEPGVLGRQLGSGAVPISEMIPKVLEKLDGVEPAPDTSSGGAGGPPEYAKSRRL